MNVNTIYKLAGASAIFAGLLFALIQFIHPEESLAALPVMARPSAIVFSLGLALLGVAIMRSTASVKTS